jgi:hypothetical protein
VQAGFERTTSVDPHQRGETSMSNLHFHRLHHHHSDRRFQIRLPPMLVASLTVVSPFVLLFLVWLAMREVVAWMWTVLPAPLAWGG